MVVRGRGGGLVLLRDRYPCVFSGMRTSEEVTEVIKAVRDDGNDTLWYMRYGLVSGVK